MYYSQCYVQKFHTKKQERVNKNYKKQQLIETDLKMCKPLELTEKLKKFPSPLLSCPHYHIYPHWSVWIYEVSVITCSKSHSQCWSQDSNWEIFPPLYCEVSLLIISIIISEY